MKKTIFKFKETMISNGEYLSDGRFLAKIELPGVAWKAPNNQATAKLVNKESFHYTHKSFDTWLPDIQQILNGEQNACHILTDTGVVLKHELFDIRLYHNIDIGYVGIDDKYHFLLDEQVVKTKDNTSPLFVTYRCVVMPICDPLAGFTYWIADNQETINPEE